MVVNKLVLHKSETAIKKPLARTYSNQIVKVTNNEEEPVLFPNRFGLNGRVASC